MQTTQQLEVNFQAFPISNFWILSISPRIRGWMHIFCIWPFMDPSNTFGLAFHGAPKIHAQRLHERLNKEFIYLASNFRCQKLEAKQKHLPWALLKTRAPKLKGFNGPNISSNFFLQCNFLFLFKPFLLIFLFCKVLTKQRVHPKRYFWLSLFHIMLSNYASCFLPHFILSCRFLHLCKLLSWLNKGW